MSKKLLTFEYNDTDDKIEIHANELGIEYLIEQLEELLKNKNHLHLMTPSWGGDGLSEEKQGEVNRLINHVKVFNW